MVNKYKKGARFERELVNLARKDSKIAFRSAGSHSPIDVTIIDINSKEIEFIQAKVNPGIMSKKDKEIFENQSGNYQVKFKLQIRNAPKNKKRKVKMSKLR